MPIKAGDFTAEGGEVIVCTTVCFWRDRLWKMDQHTTAKAGEFVPRHFKVMNSDAPIAAPKPAGQSVADVRPMAPEMWSCPNCNSRILAQDRRIHETALCPNREKPGPGRPRKDRERSENT